MEHLCDKAAVVSQQGNQIAELFSGRRDLEKRVTEMETTLFGAERNGGGWIKETKATLDEMNQGMSTLQSSTKDIIAKLNDQDSGKNRSVEVLKAALTPIATIVVLILTWILTKGKVP
jgi:hypothetical protein